MFDFMQQQQARNSADPLDVASGRFARQNPLTQGLPGISQGFGQPQAWQQARANADPLDRASGRWDRENPMPMSGYPSAMNAGILSPSPAMLAARGNADPLDVASGRFDRENPSSALGPLSRGLQSILGSSLDGTILGINRTADQWQQARARADSLDVASGRWDRENPLTRGLLSPSFTQLR